MAAEWDFLITLNEQLRGLEDPVAIQDVAVRLIGEHLHASRVNYAHIDGDAFVISRSYANGVRPVAGRGSLARLGTAIVDACRRGETVTVDDVRTDPRFTAAEREQLLADDTAAFVKTPLIKDGRWFGTFGVHNATPRNWRRDQIALVEMTADRIWATLEHRKAEAELRANEERLAFLLRLNDALRPLSDAAAIQDTAARHLCERLGVARVAYAELGDRDFIIRREHTRDDDAPGGSLRRVIMGAKVREAFARGEIVVVDDVRSDERLGDDERATLRSRQIAAAVGVSLSKDGQTVAVFGAAHDTPRAWTAREIELMREVGERTWDAVERTRAEAALREQKTRLRLALEASAGGSWTWDPRTGIGDWDDTFRAACGFTPEEVPSFETWFARVHVDDRPPMRSKHEEILKTTDRWDYTYRLIRPDGAVRWMQSLGRADRDATGRVTRLTGLELDITERRRIEDDLQARRDEEHDRALRTLLETATQGILSADARGTIVFANRAVEVMFGWTADQLMGQPIERLIPSIVRDGTTPASGLDLVGVRKDGSMFPIDVTVNHVPTSGGGRHFAFVSDITERRRTAVALQERSTELESRMTQLRQMAWDLTLAEHHARERIATTLHDGLQQLLVIVGMNLEQQLKRDAEAGAAPSEPLVEAKKQLDEAMVVSRSLNVELFPPVLQRSGLPAALTWLANWTHEKYKLHVEIAADPRADSARKDVRTLLFESVRELLFNTVKHARTDRVMLSLELDADDRLCITVTDQGVGFEPARLDDRSRAGQVGWGLFRLRERLTLLGGRLDVDSAPGRGTRVRLVAPRDAAPDTASGANEPGPAPAGTAGVLEDTRAPPDALRILIVDDHPAVRRALREILRQRPQLSVVGDASNGLEAIAQAHLLRPDVIVMDISMPQMDGVEATARIHTELPGIRILGMSMMARNETADAIEKAGAAGYFVKGTDTQRLIDDLLAFHVVRAPRDRADS